MNIIDEVKEKSELEIILLCDVQEEILPDIEKSFLEQVNKSKTFVLQCDYRKMCYIDFVTIESNL